MKEDKIVNEMRVWIDKELKKCDDRADIMKTLLKAYTSMYALVPKEGRDMLNDIEDHMKTDSVNFALEKGYIPN